MFIPSGIVHWEQNASHIDPVEMIVARSTQEAIVVPVQGHPFAPPHTVESAWGAVSGLLPIRFPRPLAEPAVRVSTQRALHGDCRQTGCGRAQGVGIPPR